MSAEPIGGLGALGINLKIFIAQLINFLIVLLVLWKWVYRPVVKMLETRAEKIEKGVRDAQTAETRLVELEKEKDRVLAQAKRDATKISQEALAIAEARKTQMIAKAKEQVEGVIIKGKQQLQAEKDAMLREARQDMAALIVEGARRVLADGVDEKTSAKTAEKALADLLK